jgi:poly-gamma-glutamate synthesis protein (capsule biosynthesis protein)
VAFNGILSTEPEKNKERFKDIRPILNKSDLVFANLEVPVKVDETRNEDKNTIFYSLPEPTEQLLKMLNIGCVSLANNHIYDCKMPGLKATIHVLDKLGIYHTGAGWLPEHTEPAIIHKNNQKIGFLAYVDKNTNPKTENHPELFINYYTIENVLSDIKKIKKQVDKIIVSLHWGVDYSHYPTREQRVIAQKLVDAGVNIIMGHHSHTLQPYEIYKGNHIFYSLGSLTFGDYIKEGKKELQALFRKTKYGLITNYDIQANRVQFISTHEKKGNFVSIINRDYQRWSGKKWKCYNLKQKYKIVNRIIVFKEKVLDRVFEYFLGYYKNPVKRLFQLSNLKKIKKLF